MKLTQDRIANFWCRLMHAEPMWPSHGQYECRTCGQLHRVCWGQSLPAATPRVPGFSPELLAQGASLSGTESRVQCSYQ